MDDQRLAVLHKALNDMTDHQIFGWRVRSVIPLPDLQVWTGDDREPDITITLGPVPPLAPPARPFGPAVQIGDGMVRIAVPAVAAYRVEEGRRIVIDTDLPPMAPDIRTFLLATVLAALCFQRGRLPLHAGVVEVDGRALVLAGESGVGKSTLAAALVRRGHRLLSDDLCLLDTDGASGPLIQPAFPRLRLWQQAANHLRIDTTGMDRVRPDIEKHPIPVSQADFHQGALPPALVANMRFLEYPQRVTLTRLDQTAVMCCYKLIYRPRLGLAMGFQSLYFKGLASLAKHSPVFDLVRPRRFDMLDATADRLMALTRGEPVDGTVA